MFNLNFKNNYRVVHINNELGNCVIGGAGTYMNELYRYRMEDTGFIYMGLGEATEDYNVADFMEQKDILIMNKDEAYKIANINCEVLVVQFYEFATLLDESIIGDKRLVYVIHSVPTPEPPPEWDAFGGNDDVREKFEKLCELSDVLVCVSEAEKRKLCKIYPKYENKIEVIYNGITYDISATLNNNYQRSRKVFGYIGRTDYRKGIYESVKALKNYDIKYKLACPKNDSSYVERIFTYIEAANMWDKVEFCGWCIGERKEKFLDSLDALIIPSLYEPFGYVVLEAMQRGLPVICSDNGGLSEILEGYKYKYSPYVEGALEKMLEEFINDSVETVEEQQQVLINNLKRFSAVMMCKRYNDVLSKL